MFLTGLIYIKRFFVFLIKFISKPIQKILLFIINTIFLKIYKVYLFIEKFLSKIFSPLKKWIFAPLGSSIIIHLVIILIAIGTTYSNLNAQETREDETSLKLRNTVIYKLTASEYNELIEEKAADISYSQTLTYLEDEDTKPYVTRTDMFDALLQDNYEPVILAKEDTIVKPSIVSTTINLQLREKIQNYTVESGDTVSAIAQKFGLNVKTILWANNLTVRSYIKPGDTIKILPVNGVLHTVKKGDQLNKIASKYNSDVDKIIEFNKLADAQDIKVDQGLIIPDGEKPAPIIPKRTTPKYTAPATVYSSNVPASSADTSNTKLLWPTDWSTITQYYSWRHTGLDIDGNYSSRIYASEDGTVIKSQGGWNGGYGLYIIIDHGGGLQTLYAHNSKLFVKPGDQVTRGQVIAMMGTTGRSTGTHIHYEVRVNGSKVNPLRYIR